MAEEDRPKRPPPLPPLPGLGAPGAGAPPPLPGLPPLPGGLPGFGGAQSGGGGLPPGLPPVSGMGGFSAGGFPGLPSFPSAPAAAAAPPAPRPAPPPMSPPGEDFERRISELEQKLQKEREKVLLANLKSQEEKTISARVENSLKEIQDKLRRERRDAEQEEGRLKLEARIRELENRLVQERETWVTTLKTQMERGEGQDKELESHFTMRVQEMERRWLEEKAHWQRVLGQKEEELRRRDSELERLKSAEAQAEKLGHLKEGLEERVHGLAEENAQLKAKAQGAMEREREYFQVKAELTTAKDQLRNYQERYERDLQQLRTGAKEREQRLLADNERLSHELSTAAQRIRSEYESEIRRVRAESDGELKKARAQADIAGAALQRMRAVGGALEKQVASLRMQASEAKQLKEELQRINDRYKAEFLVLQRKWQDREAEIRASAEKQHEKNLETERAKIKMRAAEEIQNRIVGIQEQLRREMQQELLEREKGIRAEMDRAIAERTRVLEAELERKSREGAERERQWQEKWLQKESELLALRAAADDARSRVAQYEEGRAQAMRERIELEKSLAAIGEKSGVLAGIVEEQKARLEEEQRKVHALTGEKEGFRQVERAYEDKLAEYKRHGEQLEGKLNEAESAFHALQNEKVELAETVAKVEAEHSRQLETWRRKLDLARRELESRCASLCAERDALERELAQARSGVLEKVKGLFGRKAAPARPEPPAPPPAGL